MSSTSIISIAINVYSSFALRLITCILALSATVHSNITPHARANSAALFSHHGPFITACCHAPDKAKLNSTSSTKCVTLAINVAVLTCLTMSQKVCIESTLTFSDTFPTRDGLVRNKKKIGKIKRLGKNAWIKLRLLWLKDYSDLKFDKNLTPDQHKYMNFRWMKVRRQEALHFRYFQFGQTYQATVANDPRNFRFRISW